MPGITVCSDRSMTVASRGISPPTFAILSPSRWMLTPRFGSPPLPSMKVPARTTIVNVVLGACRDGSRCLGPVGDALDREVQVLERVRVRQAQVTLASRAERGPGEARDAGLIQDAIRDRRRVAQVQPGDVREHVERPRRRAAGEAVDL